jgi:hypothetical protein
MNNSSFKEIPKIPDRPFADSPLGKLTAPKEVDEIPDGPFADSPLGKSTAPKEIPKIPDRPFADSPLDEDAPPKEFPSVLSVSDKPLVEVVERIKNCPREGGRWDGERGNSTWIPDPDAIPQKANPERKTWREILEKYGIDGIPFKDGEPDFSEISRGNVEISPFTDSRTDNFDKADIELAKQKGCTPEEVAKWRKENGYTWHECKDMKTMQKVPSEVHNNIPHSGGISESKKGNGGQA